MDCDDFADKIKEMGKRGESPYGIVNGETVHDIPAQACKGRTAKQGRTFSGYIDVENGKMRFDCAEEPEFYLEVNLSDILLYIKERDRK